MPSQQYGNLLTPRHSLILDTNANNSQDLNVSLSSVNLTITSYLIVQGISPLIWGSLSDALGRRPIYLASFTVYIISNIALSFSPNFPVLLVFRALQAAGSASTVSIGECTLKQRDLLDMTDPARQWSYPRYLASLGAWCLHQFLSSK